MRPAVNSNGSCVGDQGHHNIRHWKSKAINATIDVQNKLAIKLVTM